MIHVDLMNAPPLQILGLLGALTYILNYVSITLRLTSTDGIAYFVTNLVAASLVLVSLGHAFNAASLVIQTFFICVSLIGIGIRLRARLRRGRVDGPAHLGRID